MPQRQNLGIAPVAIHEKLTNTSDHETNDERHRPEHDRRPYRRERALNCTDRFPAPSPASVTTLIVCYVGGEQGLIHYAKAQVAADLPVELRRYAAGDPRFPGYSTGNQFLTNDQFARLVDLGRAAGAKLAALNP